MSLKSISRLIGTGDQENRKKEDFYATPVEAIDALLDREKFYGSIWEPACGDGAICKRLNVYGYNQVIATDLIYRGYGLENNETDFLRTHYRYDNIITNPPFKLATNFCLHGLNCINKKMAIFGKVIFLEGKTRRKKLWSQNKLETVYVFSERVTFNKKDYPDSGGMLAFAWFVFNKDHIGPPTIEWI